MMEPGRDCDEDLDPIDADFLRELAASKLRAGKAYRKLISAAIEGERPSADRVAPAPDSRSQEQALPASVGGYRIICGLSAGGMGDVLLALDAKGQEVAVKVLPLEREPDHEMRARFARELRAMSALCHPHVVRYFASGEDPQGAYLVMERVRGPTLQWVMDHCGAMSERDVIVLARQLALALAECWRLGFVHRDVKPDNILLDDPRPRREESFCAKLCDFGLANFLDLGPGDFHTDPTQSIGTPAYMSPEQVCGFGQADPRHDIYGLGVTLVSALLGACPFEHGSTRHVIMQKLEHRPDLGMLRDRIDPRLYALIEAMIKPAEKRIADWSQVLDRLDMIDQRGQGHAPQPAARAKGRSAAILIGLASTLAALGVLLIW